MNGGHQTTRRRLEQWLKNTACEANAVSAVQGISMARVAEAAGVAPTSGQSPFAIARGRAFEESLFADDAASMRTALIEQGVLPEGSQGLVDCRLQSDGGPLEDVTMARKKTELFLRKVAQTRHRRAMASIVAGAELCLPGDDVLPDLFLVLDVLVVRYGGKRPVLMVGEVKSYPDRGGYTSNAELAAARAQAGAYVHALQLQVARLGLSDDLVVSTEGFLVLTRPGSNAPSVRSGEDLKYQAQRAEQGLARLRTVAAAMTRGPDAARTIEAVQRASTAYCEECLSFCDRASVCRDRAFEAGDPAALGDEVARLLGTVPIPRAFELLDGSSPLSPAEEELAHQVALLKELGS